MQNIPTNDKINLKSNLKKMNKKLKYSNEVFDQTILLKLLL